MQANLHKSRSLLLAHNLCCKTKDALHIVGCVNMPCLNLGTCSVICVRVCLNLGILSILKQNTVNLQAFIDKSVDDVLPKLRQHASRVLNTS